MGDKLSSGVGTVCVGQICALNIKIYVKTTKTAVVSESINTFYEYLYNRWITKIGVSFPLSAVIKIAKNQNNHF